MVSCTPKLIIILIYFALVVGFAVYFIVEINKILDSYYPKAVSAAQAALIILTLIFFIFSVGLSILIMLINKLKTKVIKLILFFLILVTIGLGAAFAYISINSKELEILTNILKYNVENPTSEEVIWFTKTILKEATSGDGEKINEIIKSYIYARTKVAGIVMVVMLSLWGIFQILIIFVGMSAKQSSDNELKSTLNNE